MSESATPADEELSRWARDPFVWGRPQETLTGEAAAAYGRSLLEGAGVDIVAVERAVGRPRVGGGSGLRGSRSPRLNVAISDAQAALLEEAERRSGASRSQLVREALDLYLRRAV